MLKMTIDNEEVLSNNDISIKEEILSPSSTILNNVYPKSWEQDKDYVSRFYYPKDYSKLNIQNFSVEPEEAGTTIDINGSATLTDVDTTKESRVLRLLGQTSQTGTPTPSSPIPVNVVSGDNEINICGKNLFDKNSNIVNDYTFNSSGGTFSSSDFFYQSSYIAVKPNTTYCVSKPSGSSLRICEYKIDKTFIQRDFENYSFTTTANTYFIRISDKKAIKDLIQIEKGSTATTYEPYIGNTYPIYLGVENLFDGIFRQGNRYTTGLSDTTRLFTTQNFPVESGQTYTISTNLDVSIFKYAINLSTQTYPIPNTSEGNASQYYDSGWKQTSSFTFTPNQNGYLGVVIAKTNGTDSLTPSDIASFTWQLEKGSKANSYSEYGTTPIELCKIGTYQDYIYKDNGGWYLHKEIGKVVLTGASSEIWSRSGASTSSSFVGALNLPYSGISNKFGTGYSWLCDKFTYGSLGVDYKFNNYNGDATTGYQFFGLTIPTTMASDLSSFKTWLGTAKPIVYYVLATPTTTEITDTTLLEQLDALESQ